MRPTVLLAVATTWLLLLAGCGTQDPGGDMSDDPADGGPSAGATTQLLVVVDDGSGSGERSFTLSCDPPGGDHPDPEAACRALDRMKNPFAPVPADVMCTEIYGGPQTAMVTGTFRGKPVHASFDRTDGCQIARWDKHTAVLGDVGSGV